MYFPEPVLFELPVLPRVAKFVHVKLTTGQGQLQPMLVAPQALGPGLMLWAMAQPEKVRLFGGYVKRLGNGYNRAICQTKMVPDEMSARIGVAIHEFHPTRHQYLLNLPELWVFSNMVEHMIFNELVLYCQRAPQTPPLIRIKAFCDRYDFSEDDYREQSLRQMYQRHRNRVGAQAFAAEVSSEFKFVPLAA